MIDMGMFKLISVIILIAAGTFMIRKIRDRYWIVYGINHSVLTDKDYDEMSEIIRKYGMEPPARQKRTAFTTVLEYMYHVSFIIITVLVLALGNMVSPYMTFGTIGALSTIIIDEDFAYINHWVGVLVLLDYIFIGLSLFIILK